MLCIDRQFFTLLESFDIPKLSICNDEAVKIVLPLLTRCALCSPADQTTTWVKRRQLLMKKLLDFQDVNFLIESLSTDFNEVYSDCQNTVTLRKKQFQNGSKILGNDDYSNFETSNTTLQFKIVVAELKWLMIQASGELGDSTNERCPAILEMQLFRPIVTNLLCIALHELPSLLPTSDVICSLLHVNSSLDMIKRILLNSPWSVNEVCNTLIVRAKDSDNEGVQQTRIDVIKFICDISPTAATQAIQTCVSHNKLPQILAWIYLNQQNETSLFQIAEFVFTHKRIAKTLLLPRNQGGSTEESPLLSMMRKTLSEELATVVESGPESINHNRLSVLLRLYACLREIVAYKFADYEIERMYKIFPLLPLSTDQDMKLVILSLCLIITSIHQMSHYSQQLSAWLRSLAHNTKLYTQSSDTSIGQFLLLIAIHYHGNQLTTISEMVSNYLNIKPSTVKLSNTILKQIITYEVFTEPVISQLTVLLSVTKDLNANIKGYLPIHCVCQLLKSRAFSKHNVSIAEWITAQLGSVALPLHPMIPQMITLYVASTMPQQHNVRSANPQLDEDRIAQHFRDKDTEDNFASQLVFLFYVLSHQEAVHSDPAAVTRRKTTYAYSNTLISSIPTKRLVIKAYELRHQCGSLYSTLVKLVYTNLPHMCKASMWLPEMSNHRRPNKLLKLFEKPLANPASVDSIHKQYMKLRLVSESLSADDTLSVLLETIRLVVSSPVDDIPRHMTMVLSETWLAYSRIAPERLYSETVNILRGSHNSISEEQMIIDPLLVLQCLPGCKQPDLLRIVLHLISVYSRASHRYFQIQSQQRNAAGGNSTSLADTQEICYSLMSAQESATLQILMEHCLPDVQRDESILCNQREIQTLICSEIHKIIIDNPYQAKLISFQGYDRRVIPIAISGIPSMHICLDYVPELLAQPDINKQVFAIRLTASLSRQYGVHKTFTMAKLCINTLITLIGVLPVRSLITNILPVLPEVITLCHYMPVLYDDWMKLLSKILPILSACQGGPDVKDRSKSLALSYS